MNIVKQIALAIMHALLTEEFIKEIIIYLLKLAAKKSDNTIDDDIVKKIEKALIKQPESDESNA